MLTDGGGGVAVIVIILDQQEDRLALCETCKKVLPTTVVMQSQENTLGKFSKILCDGCLLLALSYFIVVDDPSSFSSIASAAHSSDSWPPWLWTAIISSLFKNHGYIPNVAITHMRRRTMMMMITINSYICQMTTINQDDDNDNDTASDDKDNVDQSTDKGEIYFLGLCHGHHYHQAFLYDYPPQDYLLVV